MENLEDKKTDNRSEDLRESNVYNRLLKERQQSFDTALSSQELLHSQFLNDYTIIFEKLKDWIDKSKTDSQNKSLSKLVKALFRMEIYTENLRVLSKTAVANYIEERRFKINAINELAECKKTINSLQKQVEYYEQEIEKFTK